MMKLKSKKEEYTLFNKFSNEWWNEDGEFKVLHRIRPLRMEYITNQLKNVKINELEILDLGCGGGLICEPLAKLGARVTGIDFVKNNIKTAKNHAKQNNLNIDYICKDIESVSFKKKFDLIIMFEILEHLTDWKNFLDKVIKNLKTNGKIIISTINRNTLSKYTAIYLAENFLGWVPKGTHDYNKFIKPEELNVYFKSQNFKIKNLMGLSFSPFENKWVITKNTKINYFCCFDKSN